ncbi:MAG: hypothetical protein U9R79_12115 [Armatimonadota bacterium]|nr:hypothetical protein [Armatimonadota bacterium]
MMCVRKASLALMCLAIIAFCALGLSQAAAQENQGGFGQAGDQPAAAEEQQEGDVGAEEEGRAGEAVEGEEGAAAEVLEAEEVEAEIEPIPPSFDFEDGQLSPHWSATGMEPMLEITRGPGQALAGQGALMLTYMPGGGNLPSVSVGPLEMVGQPSVLQFGLKTDEISSIRYGVAEEDGTEYEGYCYAPAGEWVDCRIALDELMLAQNSEDENEMLDPEQITSLTFMDLCNLPGEIGRALGIKQGLQHMWLDNVKLSPGTAPRRSQEAGGGVIVDDFDGEAALFLPVGGPEIESVAGPGGGDDGACKLIYRLGGHRWVGFVRGVGHLDLTGFDQYCLKLKAEHRARLVAVLEEWDGSKYETNLELDPEAGWTEVTLPLTQFILDPATEDENEQVDLGQLRVVILVVDTFNASVNAMGDGSFTISRISFR